MLQRNLSRVYSLDVTYINTSEPSPQENYSPFIHTHIHTDRQHTCMRDRELKIHIIFDSFFF